LAGVDLRTVQQWLGHSDMEHDAIPKAMAESAGTRGGQRDSCVGVLGNYFGCTILEDSSGAAVFKVTGEFRTVIKIL